MRIDYLTWFKNLDLELEKHPDAHLLLSSSVHEPTELLQRHFIEFARAELPNALLRTNSWGYEPLAEAIAERRSCKPEQILTTNGASNAIYLVCRAFLKAGDHVVVESPGYEPLLAAPEFMGCRVGQLPRRLPDRAVDLSDLKAALRPDTKLLMLSNLHNPSGAYMSERDLVAVADVAREVSKSIRIVVDEIYLDFAGERRTTAANLDGVFISIESLTKVYGLGSLHCGWIVADRQTADAIRRLHVIVEGSGSKALDALSASIMRDLDSFLARSLQVVSENRVILAGSISPLLDDHLLEGTIPAHGCIYFVKTPSISDTTGFCTDLARRFGVHVVPGIFFGEPDHIRIGFGGPRQRLEESLAKFVAGVHALVCNI